MRAEIGQVGRGLYEARDGRQSDRSMSFSFTERVHTTRQSLQHIYRSTDHRKPYTHHSHLQHEALYIMDKTYKYMISIGKKIALNDL